MVNPVGLSADFKLDESPKEAFIPMESPKSVYEKLKQFRVPFIDRAEDSAKYTIPALMPPTERTSLTSHDELYQPYQSLGSRGVNALAANLLMTLLPVSYTHLTLPTNREV